MKQLDLIAPVKMRVERDSSFPLVDVPPYNVANPPDANLIESIRTLGMLDDIIIVDIDGHRFLKSGRRRCEAAKLLNLVFVPAKIVYTDAKTASIIGVAANANRSPNPISELEDITSLITMGMSVREVYDLTGMPIQTIRKRIALAALPNEIVNGVAMGTVTLATAEACLSLKQSQMVEAVEMLAKAGRLRRNDVLDLKRVQINRATSVMPDSLFDLPEETQEQPDRDARGMLGHIAGRIELVMDGTNYYLRDIVDEIRDWLEAHPA